MATFQEQMPPRTGVLLVNLGTPKDPTPEKVGKYLKEFLMDPWVLDMPAPLRWLLVHAFIVPKRRYASSELYQKIWTERGSPLLFHSQDLSAKVQDFLGSSYTVELGMRYGEPSLESALKKLQERGAARLVILPLYPQYSLAATESSIRKIEKMVPRIFRHSVAVQFVPPFYDEEKYLDAVAEVSRPGLKASRFDKVVFSFHGLPERHCQRTDKSGAHCLKQANCCETVSEVNADCYRAQSFATARALARRLDLRMEDYLVSFQSRLGSTPWIRPFTDELYASLPKQGVRRLAVLSPSFVADCLETIEEIQIRGKKQFLAAGGEELILIPSLNSEKAWVQAVSEFVSSF